MVLRLAKPEDFENFNLLYSNLNYDMLYECTQNDSSYDFDDKLYEEIDELYEEFFDSLEISKEEFINILEEKWQKIYIIESSDTTIGATWLRLISGKRWKLAVLFILPEFKHKLLEVINFILNQKGINELDISPTSSYVCKLLVEEMHAEKISNFYYRLKKPK